MAVTSFYTGSLRYDIHGRKRKKHALNSKKRKPNISEFKPLHLEKTFAQQRSEDHRSKYPSMDMASVYTPQKDQSWKAEESKNFTVAPAYNKGAYQVIPRKDVKHIGK